MQLFFSAIDTVKGAALLVIDRAEAPFLPSAQIHPNPSRTVPRHLV